MDRQYTFAGEEGDDFVPFPLGLGHRNALSAAVLSAIKAVDGGIHTCLAEYDPAPTLWTIPPAYGGSFNNVSLQIACDTINMKTSAEYVQGLHALIEHFRDYGWDTHTEKMLERRLGAYGMNPILFDRTNYDLGLFVIELICASVRRVGGYMVLDDDKFGLRVPNTLTNQWDLLGFVGGKLNYYDYFIEPDRLVEFIFQDRGTVLVKEYGVYDRIVIWANKNALLLDDAGGLVTAVTLLKLSNHPEEEGQLETKLRNASFRAPLPKPDRVSYEFIDELRGIWLEGANVNPEEALRGMFSKLVPDLFDSTVFESYFGTVPIPGVRMEPKRLFKVGRGLDKLVAYLMKE